MARSIRAGVIAVLLGLALTTVARAQQPAMTDADVGRVKAEVTAAVDKYYAFFSAHNMKALPEEIFNIPYNTRYKTDGSVMSVGGVSYLFGWTKQGWRVVSYTGHARDKVVRCD